MTGGEEQSTVVCKSERSHVGSDEEEEESNSRSLQRMRLNDPEATEIYTGDDTLSLHEALPSFFNNINTKEIKTVES